MASDAATDAASKGKSAIAWAFNQLHPFGQNGKLGRTLLYTTSLAGIGAAAAFATGGLSLPFNTAIASMVAAPGAAAGTVATTAATQGFLPTVGSALGEYLAHAGNGVAFLGQTGVDIINNGDWAKFASAANDMGDALMPTGTS